MWDRQVTDACGLHPTAVRRVGVRSRRFVVQRTRFIHRMSECLTSRCRTVGRLQRRPRRRTCSGRFGTPSFAGALLQKQSEKCAGPDRPVGRTCRPSAPVPSGADRCGRRREIPAEKRCPRRRTPQLRDWRCLGVLPSSGPFKWGASARSGALSVIGAGLQQTRQLRFVFRPAPCFFRWQRWAFSIRCGEIRGTTFKQKNHDHRCYRRPGVCRIAAGS
jgi:hypothetical protein